MAHGNVGNKNGVGNRGGGSQSIQNRELMKKVRDLTLNKIHDILSQPVVKMQKDDYDLYKELLLRLAGTVLPRINEVSGLDGEPLVVQIAPEVAAKYNIKPGKAKKANDENESATSSPSEDSE